MGDSKQFKNNEKDSSSLSSRESVLNDDEPEEEIKEGEG